MGYTTYFTGEFTITPALPEQLVTDLNDFCSTRHEERTTSMPVGLDQWNRPYTGPLRDTTEIGIWCNWEFDGAPGADATIMRWNDSEKSYEMDRWAAYIAEHLIPEGHTIEGTVDAQGEDAEDRWRMVATGRTIAVQTPTVTWPDA